MVFGGTRLEPARNLNPEAFTAIVEVSDSCSGLNEGGQSERRADGQKKARG
jgi:hypothetical protein